MSVTDNTTETTKVVSFAMFPADLRTKRFVPKLRLRVVNRKSLKKTELTLHATCTM